MADQEHTPIEAAEEWRPVVGFPRYMVSDLGRVRGPRGLIRLSRQKKGSRYLRVSLHEGAVQKSRQVHGLVLNAFVGPRGAGETGSHIDGNPSNNALSNLCWELHQKNIHRNWAHGTMRSGTENGRALLTRAEVRSIFSGYRVRDKVWGTAALAKTHGISEGTIRLILMRKRYTKETADLPDPVRRAPNVCGYPKGRPTFFDRRGVPARPRSDAGDEALSPQP